MWRKCGLPARRCKRFRQSRCSQSLSNVLMRVDKQENRPVLQQHLIEDYPGGSRSGLVGTGTVEGIWRTLDFGENGRKAVLSFERALIQIGEAENIAAVVGVLH